LNPYCGDRRASTEKDTMNKKETLQLRRYYSSNKYWDCGGGKARRRVREMSSNIDGKGRGEAVGHKGRGKTLLWQESPDGIVTHNLKGYFPWHVSKFVSEKKCCVLAVINVYRRSHNRQWTQRQR